MGAKTPNAPVVHGGHRLLTGVGPPTSRSFAVDARWTVLWGCSDPHDRDAWRRFGRRASTPNIASLKHVSTGCLTGARPAARSGEGRDWPFAIRLIRASLRPSGAAAAAWVIPAAFRKTLIGWTPSVPGGGRPATWQDDTAEDLVKVER